MTTVALSLGAADDPWIVMWGDIEAEINTISALNTQTNKQIQKHKSNFSGRELVAWHNFVTEWMAWKKQWLGQSKMLSATSGAWKTVKDYKTRSLEWSAFVEQRLGITTPGKPRAPLAETSWYNSPWVWVATGAVVLFAGGYFVRSFGVASVARARAERERQRVQRRARA